MQRAPDFPTPDGWVFKSFPDSFSDAAGPYYFRTDGGPGVGFYGEARHANLGDVIHGGALMTLADMAIFQVCWPALDGSRAVTVSLNSEFLNPAPLGVFIEAGGEITKAGKSLIMARGLVKTGDTPLLAWSGVLKRISAPLQRDGSAPRQD